MPSTAQEVKADADAEGVRETVEVATFEEARIGATTTDRRVGWRDDKATTEYIYNRCSGIPAKNICWEEGKKSVLIYSVASKNKPQEGSFPPPSPSPTHNPGQ